MFDYIADFIVARRRSILAVIAAIFVVSAITAPGIDFDFTPQELFESTDDAHEYREVFAERFGREDNLVPILVEGDQLFDPDVLEPLRDLTYQLQQHDQIDDARSVATLSLPRPDSISADPHLEQARDVDDDTGLLEGPPVDDDQARQLAEYAESEPLIENRLVDDEATTGLIGVWIDPDLQDASELEVVLAEIEDLVDRYEFPDGVSLTPQGIPALRVTIVDQLRAEQLFFIPLTTLVFLGILLLLFRRPSGILLPMGTVVVALSATLATMVATNADINIINNVLPTLIFVIGISDSIHMVTRHSEEVALGKDHLEAVREMIRHTGAACLLTTSTTAVGFLSLLAADTAILRSFGWQAAMGMGFAYLATLLFLSAGLTYMKPVVRTSRGDSDDPPLLEKSLMVVADNIMARPWTTITVSLLITAAVGFQAKDLRVDTYVMDILSEDHPTRQASDHIEDRLGGIMPLEISLEGDQRDVFRHPDVYGAVHDLQQYLEDQPTVLSTESYVDYLQTSRVAVVGDRDERDVLPDSRDEIEQLLVLIGDAPNADDELSNFVTDNYRNARILARVDDAGANAHLQLADQLRGEIDELFDDRVDYRITGDAYVASAALDAFVRDLAVSLGIAIIVIFGLMTIVFRSLKIGLVSLLPNTVPLVLAVGYMGWTGINLDSTTIIIFAIGLGIAVDDSIHFFARFVEERARRDDLRDAIVQTYHGAGRAILMTSLLLLVGMGIIQFSDFVPTQQFATLIGIVIGGAILADLFLLPAVLYLVYSKFPGNSGKSARFLSTNEPDEAGDSTPDRGDPSGTTE